MNQQSISIALSIVTMLLANLSLGQDEFEREPINYFTATTNDPVARLQRALDKGQVRLQRDEKHGYLPAVLEHLGISEHSQTLVHSKTSLQRSKISPRTPRALYFNDDCYIGWCQYSDIMEVTAMDNRLGAVFYTLNQSEDPKFVRDKGQCNTCHATSRTQGVPGLLVRSVFSNRGGIPQLGSGTYNIDHRSPFERRWGGWYVTGTHGEMRHMGNTFATDRRNPEKLDRELGANQTQLGNLVDPKDYCRGTSDIVALMVLEHQCQMHNYITRAAFETRLALYQNQVMNKVLERPVTYRSESATRRINSSAEKLVNYMLFQDEFRLASKVEGNERYVADFASLAVRDSKGRSLRDFDLSDRMFKYPCSYLIYSHSFRGLPTEVLQPVFSLLDEALSERKTQYDLSHAQRRAIREILVETHPEFRAFLASR